MVYKKNLTTTYKINGREYTVTAPALFDDQTNEYVPNDKLDDQAVEIARQKYRDDLGLISPMELKKYRAKVGLSQRDLAELTGLSPNTVALYEAGAFPTTTNNRILKALINNAAILKDYLTENKAKYSTNLKQKIEAYLNNEHVSVSFNYRKPKFTAVQLANWFRVNNYFARENDPNIDPITQMQVVKLLYFAYGRFLVRNHARLFASKIIHLQYGPVVEEVHRKFSGQVILDLGKPDKEAFTDYNLVSSDQEISGLLEEVNRDYGDYTASGLSKITHRNGSPWSLTAKGCEIQDQLIFDHFSKNQEE